VTRWTQSCAASAEVRHTSAQKRVYLLDCAGGR
jgi:hypothetical protein